jgi:3-hydroxyacyl-[acyl-carrier-protein] dehydratase
MPKTDQNILKIDRIMHENGSIQATLSTNVESEIFKGHFPGQPVVPGACILQTLKEVLELALNKTLQLKRAGQLKFISMIMPDNEKFTLTLSYKFIENEISVTAKLTHAEIVCFKFQGSFVIA